MILLIDNYDSFVHNLARYFRRLGKDTLVVRNDEIEKAQVRTMQPEAIILSPGPCTPNEAGCSLAMVHEFYQKIPILGVCLGHQVIAKALGAKIVRCEPMHGRVSKIENDQEGIFTGLPAKFEVCRYHSLTIDPDHLPKQLVVSATTNDPIIMAIRHRKYPVVGVQFHPEAILTCYGLEMLASFMKIAGIVYDRANVANEEELWTPIVERKNLTSDDDLAHPNVPVTF